MDDLLPGETGEFFFFPSRIKYTEREIDFIANSLRSMNSWMSVEG